MKFITSCHFSFKLFCPSRLSINVPEEQSIINTEKHFVCTVYLILPCPINISFWLWNHYVYRSCSTSERFCDITWTHDKRLRKVCLTFWQIVFPSGCLFWASGWFSALKCVSLIARKSTFLASWLWSRSTFGWIDLSVFKECQRLATYGFAAT